MRGYRAPIIWYLLPMPDITVTPTGTDLFTVTIADATSSTTHRVRVSAIDLRRIAPGVQPVRLVEESFRFLLEHEPKESILRTFDLPVIGRYFPEYEQVIRSRLS